MSDSVRAWFYGWRRYRRAPDSLKAIVLEQMDLLGPDDLDLMLELDEVYDSHSD